MASLKEYRNIRLGKLQALHKLGITPYPSSSSRDHDCRQIIEDFKDLKGRTATVAGRITAIRQHGKVRFFDIKDASGTVQLLLRADDMKPAEYGQSQLNFQDLELLDLGDFVEARGVVMKTKLGQISISAEYIRLLSKSLRPMPDRWSGLKDKETRLRRRYLDTNLNQEVQERFSRRSLFWKVHRDFLDSHGFAEINVPVLEHTTGGADAKPFKTHMDALNEDFYLRISHELPLKRLIGGGFEKVYDIGPRFRNENYTDEHLPEHVAMEFYWAYADWKKGMELVRALFQRIVDEVYGRSQFTIRGHQVEMANDWPELDFAEAMREHYRIDVFNCSLEDIKKLLKKYDLELEQINVARGIDKLWKRIRNTVSGPAFVVNTPKFLSPLAKSSPKNIQVTERFQPIIAGTELGNGWSELNDPQDQLQRFLDQQNLREAGDQEAQMLDIDYVEMLEYGMPPTFGYGHSERVFWMLEDVPAREGVPFSQLRAETDEVTKSIYPDLF